MDLIDTHLTAPTAIGPRSFDQLLADRLANPDVRAAYNAAASRRARHAAIGRAFGILLAALLAPALAGVLTRCGR